MLQRLQSLLLLLAAAVNAAVLFLPIWVVENPGQDSAARLYGMKITLEGTASQSIDPVISVGDDFMILVHIMLVIASSVFLIYIIFNYQDRIKQSRLTYVGVALICIQVVVGVVLTTGLGERINLSETNGGEFQIGFFAPLLAIGLAWFAARRMKSDEELVRSADRFR